MLLVAKGLGTLERKHHHRNVGRLVGPRDTGRIADTPRAGFLWAADNDCFNGFDETLYVRMLDKCEGVPGGLFVTCPDVVADAAATFNLYLKWAKEILGRGLPLGYVAQDGATVADVPWNGTSALFVGGTTEFKLGPDAAVLVTEARRRGKWVHMGRVNTRRRIRYASALGCDSIDGTQFSMFTDTHLPWGADHAAAPRQGMLVSGEGS